MSNVLALADFAGMSEDAVKVKLSEDFGIALSTIENIEIIVAYMSVGDFGCDSSAFIVFRENGKLYEVNASHCSCYGFDSDSYMDDGSTQWQPELIDSIDAVLKREDWRLVSAGWNTGHDVESNAAQIRAKLSNLPVQVDCGGCAPPVIVS